MTERFDGSVRLTADPLCQQCGKPIDIPVDEAPDGGIVFAPSKCRLCLTSAAPQFDLTVADAGTFQLQGPPAFKSTVRQRAVVRRCECCDGPTFDDGEETHAFLCVEFRALAKRVERLEKRLARDAEEERLG